MPQLAPPCACRDALVFEPGRCARCGRWLADAIDTPDELGINVGYAVLAQRLEQVADELRAEATAAGWPPEEPAGYARWLEAKLRIAEGRQARPAARTRLSGHVADHQPVLGLSVRSVLAPEVL